MKVAIFPGTFNPIHIAHLIIAENARDQCGIDKVLFITSNIPPHRTENIAKAKHRHVMVQLSCEGYEFFEPSDIEINREGPSYTYETLISIKQLYSKLEKLYLIIGSDAISQLNTWNYAQEIVDITNFLVIPRPGTQDVNCCLKQTGLSNFKCEIIKSPLMNISSTLIRDKIYNEQSIKFLVLDSVRKYIYENNLYGK